MNFQLHKISKVEEIDINKFLGARVSGGGGGGISDHEIDTPRNFVQSLRSKHMKYDDETFERKFQFRYLLRAFQTFMLHHKKNFSNSCDTKNNKNKLILPNISTFNNSKNDSQAHRRSFFGLKNITQPLLSKNNSTINEFYSNLNYNNDDNNNSKNKIERSNSTMFSQNVSKLATGNIFEFNKYLNTKVSNEAIIKINKKRYMESLKNYREKNKDAKSKFNLQLNKLKNEKFPKSKQLEYFKEFEIKFNPRKLYNLLKKESKFFEIEKEDKNLHFLYEKNKIYENNFLNNKKFYADNTKEKLSKIMNTNDFVKPSRRIIENMIRKNRDIELFEKSSSFSEI